MATKKNVRVNMKSKQTTSFTDDDYVSVSSRKFAPSWNPKKDDVLFLIPISVKTIEKRTSSKKGKKTNTDTTFITCTLFRCSEDVEFVTGTEKEPVEVKSGQEVSIFNCKAFEGDEQTEQKLIYHDGNDFVFTDMAAYCKDNSIPIRITHNGKIKIRGGKTFNAIDISVPSSVLDAIK